MNADIIFHLLDIQSQDMAIQEANEETVEVTYESDIEEDEEIQTRPHPRPPAAPAAKQLVLHLFGATEHGQSIRCDVTGFRPTFYLRLPTDHDASRSIAQIKEYLKSHDVPLAELTFQRVKRKVFYGFTASTDYEFLQLTLPSLALFRSTRGLFLDEGFCYRTTGRDGGRGLPYRVEVFEANIDPLLRFLHAQNLQPCGWVRVRDGVSSITEGALGTGLIVIDCDYEQILPTVGPRVSAPLLIASWDIECCSLTGDFPVAQRTWSKAAKELLALGHAATPQHLINALTWTSSPPTGCPTGMTPIYCSPPRHGITTEGLQAMATRALRNLGVYETQEELEKYLRQTLGGITLRGDPVIQIGTTLTRVGSTEMEHHLFVFPSCAPLTGITVHEFTTERDMILEWFRWMGEQNPDILLGYNICGFDEAYVWARAKELGLIKVTAGRYGDVEQPHKVIADFTRLAPLGRAMRLEEKFLSSSAMGDNRMYVWSTQGRLQLDMFHYIKRNNVLPSYKLDEVTKHFMSGKLKGCTYDAETGQLQLTVAGAVKDVKVGRSITLLDETGETVSPKLTVEHVDGAVLTFTVELDADQRAELDDAVRWVVVKDDVSPQDIFRLHRESAEGRATVGRYCIQDCVLVIDLFKKLETFNNSMSMANVCTVPMNYIFSRGQGIKIESLIFKFCQERGIVIPVLPSPSGAGAGAGASSGDDTYEGAIVLDPEPGFYSTSPIGVCDFASLYPSTIVSENISHDSLLWVKDYAYPDQTGESAWVADHWIGSVGFDEDHPAVRDRYAFTDIEYDILRPDPADTRKHPQKIKQGRRICRFAQPLDGSKSTLPQITTWLLTARSAKKKEMKAEKDPERYALLDAEQLAYKLTGNSLYGQLGSSTFKIRLQALAASTTAYGRKQILFAKAAIEKFYGPGADPRCAARCMAKVVYGDSVTGDTPVRIRCRGVESVVPIRHLGSLEPLREWYEDRGKQFYELRECEAWTERGWTRVERIIMHACQKRLLRVTVENGDIVVTEDHSLLRANGETVSPKDLKKGDRLLSTAHPQGVRVTELQEIGAYERATKGYDVVYDLTTANHHFQAGPEGLIVHNTDSLFVEFNPRNPETGERLVGREARQATIDITDEAGHFITKALAAPHDFEFDKAFDPLLMFSKKRYAGNMYEENADDYYHKYMGIALKRRDNAPIVKTIFGGAMKMLLDHRDVAGAFALVKDKCRDLVEGRVSLGQLTVTKSLRADYADPARIAHKALADRIALRDPGNAPAAGDRIGYVYIRPPAGKEASKLQGERIETPAFIREHGLVPDYRHYVEHQLQNPISQAFGILVEHVPGFVPSMLTGCPTPDDLDRYLVFREGVAARLLFTDALESDAIRGWEAEHKRTLITAGFNALFRGKGAILPKAPAATQVPQAQERSQVTRPRTLMIETAKDAPLPAVFTAPHTTHTTMSSLKADKLAMEDRRKAAAKKAAATRAAKKKEAAAAGAVGAAEATEASAT